MSNPFGSSVVSPSWEGDKKSVTVLTIHPGVFSQESGGREWAEKTWISESQSKWQLPSPEKDNLLLSPGPAQQRILVLHYGFHSRYKEPSVSHMVLLGQTQVLWTELWAGNQSTWISIPAQSLLCNSSRFNSHLQNRNHITTLLLLQSSCETWVDIREPRTVSAGKSSSGAVSFQMQEFCPELFWQMFFLLLHKDRDSRQLRATPPLAGYLCELRSAQSWSWSRASLSYVSFTQLIPWELEAVIFLPLVCSSPEQQSQIPHSLCFKSSILWTPPLLIYPTHPTPEENTRNLASPKHNHFNPVTILLLTQPTIVQDF